MSRYRFDPEPLAATNAAGGMQSTDNKKLISHYQNNFL
jgi:hypothetical protein